jgi:hypothetical protein
VGQRWGSGPRVVEHSNLLAGSLGDRRGGGSFSIMSGFSNKMSRWLQVKRNMKCSLGWANVLSDDPRPGCNRKQPVIPAKTHRFDTSEWHRADQPNPLRLRQLLAVEPTTCGLRHQDRPWTHSGTQVQELKCPG